MRTQLTPRAVLAMSCLVATLTSCTSVGQPGGVGYMATITVINRTTAEIRVWSGQGGQHSFTVPACGEVTRDAFPVNWWWLGADGRNSFHSGGGISSGQSFVLVTNTPAQTSERPTTLPPCAGLLQGSNAARLM